ncbi:MAG: hypothetical protein NZ602_14075 [Thermoguttaceae bacterium]|nr:hypothetical protein [Thermoguttaceae bacterium]MDW8037622.1 hypothetical protein [Thermoguttaceae bacterium]
MSDETIADSRNSQPTRAAGPLGNKGAAEREKLELAGLKLLKDFVQMVVKRDGKLS